jgi:hypothetical protein
MGYEVPVEIDEDGIQYRQTPLSAEICTAAEVIPSQIGYDRFGGEDFLEGHILSIRLATKDSVASALSLDLSSLSGNVLRVDYETWAKPSEFDAANPALATYRREYIFAEETVIVAREVFLYALGPEYRYLHWEQDEGNHCNVIDAGLSPDSIQDLCNEIFSSHAEEIIEWLADEDVPDTWPPPFKALYAQVKSQQDREELEDQKREDEANNSVELIQFSTHCRIEFDTEKARLFADSLHGAHRLYATLSFAGEDEVELRSIRIHLWKKVQNLFGWKAIKESTISLPNKVSKSEAADVLRDALKDGRLVRAIQS